MSCQPVVKLEKFPSIAFNSSVSFGEGDAVALNWQLQSDGVYTAEAGGKWKLEVTEKGSRSSFKVTAVLDKVQDKVVFKYFELSELAADHILPQTAFKGCSSCDLKKLEAETSIFGETVVSITRDGVTMQLSTPYQ
ncbi:MAG: hypothetical protein J6R00_10990, partial [Lentisphaeria bacterium]|nr:hypothetical protein [Lentisphaeria bacterium]